MNEKSQNDKSMPSNGRKYLEEISKMHKNQEGVPNDGVTNMKNVDTIHEKGRHDDGFFHTVKKASDNHPSESHVTGVCPHPYISACYNLMLQFVPYT